MERWVLKVQALEQKKHYYEAILHRELDEKFAMLKLLSEELQMRSDQIRRQKTA